MGFGQAAMLAALAAVVLPIIAHLIFRRRARPVDLGALRFLKIAVRQDTRRRTLKRWILLALRIGCVVLLALLFARPYRAESTAGGDAGPTVVLIDRSASMARLHNGERLIDRAVRELPQVLATVPARSRVEVAYRSDSRRKTARTCARYSTSWTASAAARASKSRKGTARSVMHAMLGNAAVAAVRHVAWLLVLLKLVTPPSSTFRCRCCRPPGAPVTRGQRGLVAS